MLGYFQFQTHPENKVRRRTKRHESEITDWQYMFTFPVSVAALAQLLTVESCEYLKCSRRTYNRANQAPEHTILETVLLKVKNDFHLAMDTGWCWAVILLAQSAGFNSTPLHFEWLLQNPTVRLLTGGTRLGPKHIFSCICYIIDLQYLWRRDFIISNAL